MDWIKTLKKYIFTVKCAGSRTAFFAEKLYLAMKVCAATGTTEYYRENNSQVD